MLVDTYADEYSRLRNAIRERLDAAQPLLAADMRQLEDWLDKLTAVSATLAQAKSYERAPAAREPIREEQLCEINALARAIQVRTR